MTAISVASVVSDVITSTKLI